MENDFKTALSLLKRGQPPGNTEILNEISVGLGPLSDFISSHYFNEYISNGGSKIKFVTGKPGSGKTHFLQLLSAEAKKQGFITVHISAKEVWLHDFKDIYLDILSQTDLMHCLQRCATHVIKELGYNFFDIPHGLTFVDYLSSLGEFDAITKKEMA